MGNAVVVNQVELSFLKVTMLMVVDIPYNMF